jgi:hypothetical protein
MGQSMQIKLEITTKIKIGLHYISSSKKVSINNKKERPTVIYTHSNSNGTVNDSKTDSNNNKTGAANQQKNKERIDWSRNKLRISLSWVKPCHR